MGTTKLNSFWQLTREQSAEGEILRRRLAATGALTIGFCGLLTAVGLGVVVLVLLAAVTASVGLAAFLTAWPRLRAGGRAGLAYAGASVGRVRERGRTTRAQLVPFWRSGIRVARTASVEARTHGNALARATVESGSRVGRTVGQKARSAAAELGPRVARHDPKREAIRLNAIGTQQRRAGRYDEAVEAHRTALELLRGLGDRRGVALTQSNLALALSHAGDDAWAIGLFEEAAATLHELGDEEREAQIMANLGVTHRRHGRPEEGDNVLELALSKLSPASSAYRAIEAELRRAS